MDPGHIINSKIYYIGKSRNYLICMKHQINFILQICNQSINLIIVVTNNEDNQDFFVEVLLRQS